MKKYITTALVLTLITALCAALIASMNLVTSSIIDKNNENKKASLCQEIFKDYDAESSELVSEGFSSSSILEKIVAYDSNSSLLGYIYTVNGSNAYGEIELLVGITEEYTLAGVRFITNGHSFANEAESHLNNQYNSGMSLDDIFNIDLTSSDVTAGATYASKLIRTLVAAAFEDCKGGTN